MIEKIISKLMEALNIAESDAQKVLAGLAILGIAISWFILGSFFTNDTEITKEERAQESLAQKFAEDANRAFNK